MKKISKINLENFRAFTGKREINFNNVNDEPADFVCIYGKNGFGKTSLFDGFEWFFTGEIHLLEKELQSNVSRYKGNILRNRYASEDENAGVDIEFSDGTNGHRTIVKRSDSINDYGKGRASGEYKDLIKKKQILPHSKIDSFVYASKPTQVYEEWGNFWDPDNSQRNFFKTIYSVYKNIENENRLCDDKLGEVLKKLEELNIEKKVEEYNKAVIEFNNMDISEIAKLKPLQYSDKGEIDVNSILSGEKLLEPLNDYISMKGYLNNQCEYLEKYFEEYSEYEKEQEEIYGKRKRWESIIKKCNEKKALLEKKEKAFSCINRIRKNRDSIANLCDEKWFLIYQKFTEAKTKYAKINEEAINIDLQKQKIGNKVDLLKESKKTYSLKLKNLSDSYLEWEIQIEELEMQEATISNKDTQSRFVENIDDISKKKNIYEKELKYLLRASVGNYDKFIESLKENELSLYNWIMEFYNRIKKFRDAVKDCRRIEKETKCKYEEMKADVESLDELLTLARKEIQQENTHTCPVCKSSFTNMQELLDRLDLSIQQEVLSSIKAQWDTYKEVLKKQKKLMKMSAII